MDFKTKKNWALGGLGAGLLLWLGYQTFKTKGTLPQTVTELDLERYAGDWYEIARLPNPFQKFDDVGGLERYRLKKNKLKVTFQWHSHHFETPQKTRKGKVWQPNKEDPGKLKAQFFPLVKADYWVLELGENYEYVVVGTPNKKWLWILSRTPTLSEQTYQTLLARLNSQGWKTERLQRIPQLPV